jgi:hypothetical protein
MSWWKSRNFSKKYSQFSFHFFRWAYFRSLLESSYLANIDQCIFCRGQCRQRRNFLSPSFCTTEFAFSARDGAPPALCAKFANYFCQRIRKSWTGYSPWLSQHHIVSMGRGVTIGCFSFHKNNSHKAAEGKSDEIIALLYSVDSWHFLCEEI